MADNTQPSNTNTTSSGDKAFYFRTRIAGLSVLTGGDDGVAPHRVRFIPVWERYEGDQVRFGYLKTSKKVAIEKCLSDPNVEEISADEYDRIMEKASSGADPNTKLSAY